MKQRCDSVDQILNITFAQQHDDDFKMLNCLGADTTIRNVIYILTAKLMLGSTFTKTKQSRLAGTDDPQDTNYPLTILYQTAR